MKRYVCLAVAATMALGATVAVAQQDPIAARKALMKANGAAAGAMTRMGRGETPYDAAAVKAAFANWANAAKQLPGLFPDSSKSGDTRALPEIWTDRAKFDAVVAKFGKDVADNEAKAATDLEGLKVAMAAVSKNCADCHQAFRKPQ